MAEKFGLEQVFRNGGAVDGDEGLVTTQGTSMDIMGHDFLAGTGFTRDQDAGFRRSDLIGKSDDIAHFRILENQRMAVFCDGRKNGGDEFGVRRERNVLLGTGAYRVDRGAGIRLDTASDDRNADMFALQPENEVADIRSDIDHHQVGTAPRAQRINRLVDRFRVCNLGALGHRHLGGGGELPIQGSDDQKAHQRLLYFLDSVLVSR